AAARGGAGAARPRGRTAERLRPVSQRRIRSGGARRRRGGVEEYPAGVDGPGDGSADERRGAEGVRREGDALAGPAGEGREVRLRRAPGGGHGAERTAGRPDERGGAGGGDRGRGPAAGDEAATGTGQPDARPEAAAAAALRRRDG